MKGTLRLSGARVLAVHTYIELVYYNIIVMISKAYQNVTVFLILTPQDMVDEKERERYRQLMEVIGWFFFDLFILGYVEDPVTGKSFRLPGGLQWAVYIEVRDIIFSTSLHVHVYILYINNMCHQ